MLACLLIAHDDSELRSELVRMCREVGHRTLEADRAEHVVAMAREACPAVVLLGSFADGTTTEVLTEALVNFDPSPAVIAIAGPRAESAGLGALEAGAWGVVQEPVQAEVLLSTIARALGQQRVRLERDRLRREASDSAAGSMTGHSRAAQEVVETIHRVAHAPKVPVLISGQRGTGKQFVARSIHEESSRAGGPFLTVHCAGEGSETIGLELFGYEAGASPEGDPRGYDGLFAEASGGTLLLREVGQLSLSMQARLLAALTQRCYRRVGGSQDLPLSVRILASTCENLALKARQETFREDLYHRLNVLSIRVPSLQERREDIPFIAVQLLERCCRELSSPFNGFSAPAVMMLQEHGWPGNVHELKCAIERATVLADGAPLDVQHLWPASRSQATSSPEHGQTATGGAWALKDMEETLIRNALARFEGNRSRVARELGINRSTLYNKLKVYGIG